MKRSRTGEEKQLASSSSLSTFVCALINIEQESTSIFLLSSSESTRYIGGLWDHLKSLNELILDAKTAGNMIAEN